MNKTLWIINEYAGSPYHGMGLRHYYLAKELINLGFNVYIFTATYSHLLRNYKISNKIYEIENISGVNFVWIKTIKYKGANDKRRVLKWLDFSAKLNFFPYSKVSKLVLKPDYIVASTPEIFHLIPSMKLADKFNAKFIYEVRDIWPLSLVEIGNLSYNNPLIRLMKKIELRSYNRADIIISLLPNFKEYLKDEKINFKRLEIIPNGICIDDFLNLKKLPKEIERKIPKDKFIVAYTGTFGKANALEYLIKAAKILERLPDIHFLLVGKGEEEDNLRKLIKKLKIKNITFLPPISKSQVLYLLKNYVNICYIGLKNKKIFKYGVSPNKLFDYALVEKPIIYAINSSPNLVKIANCGITVESENPKAISDGILKLYNLSEKERNILGKNGKNYVLKHHTYKNLAKKLKDVLYDIEKS